MASKSFNLLPTGYARSTLRYEFQPKQSLNITDLGGGYNTRDADIDIADNELSGGQNADLNIDRSVSKRKGHTLYGNYIGTTTKILDLVTHEPAGGTAEFLSIYDTSVLRYVAGVWTALTDATLTTNLRADHAFFPLTNKTYITNGTDTVVKYASGSAAVQTDTDFKKGKFIVHYKNRLLTNITNQLWYTDLGVDTFSSNNYLKSSEDITGLEVLWDKLLVSGKHTIYVIQNFVFNGVASGPESFLPLKSDFGAIYDRTMKRVNNLVYFFGQDSQSISGVYATDGTSVQLISDKIRNDLNSIAPGQITNACATAWGRFYRLSVTMSGETINNREYLYDTQERRWLPPYTSIPEGFSCYTTVETNGQLDVYAGSQSDGAIYKLNQVNYDETSSEKYTTTTNSYDAAIDANPAKRAAQSFKLTDFTADRSVPITQAYIKLKKNSGTTTGLTVRIETDNNNTPSGTLVNDQATTTINAISTTSYAYVKATFSNLTVAGTTKYWLVVKHTTELTGNSKYFWGGDDSSPTYANGSTSLYVGATGGTVTFNPGATAIDGYVTGATGGSQSFSSLRSGSGSGAETGTLEISTNITADPDTTNLFSELDRGYVLFDTSSLPDDAVISSATLGLYCSFVADDFSQSVGLTAGTPTSDTALVASDYSIGNFGSTRFATDKTLSSLTVNAYNNFSLNASGISAVSLTGITHLAVRLSCDIDNSAPTWVSEAGSSAIFASSRSTHKPMLTIIYTSGTTQGVWTSDNTIDQNFLLFTESDIDWFVDTKAFFLAPQGQRSHIRDNFITAKATGVYNAEFGINSGTYSSFDTESFSLDTNSALWGTMVYGTSIYGEPSRAESRIRIFGIRARTAKFRLRNRFANQPVTVYAFRTTYEIIPKIK